MVLLNLTPLALTHQCSLSRSRCRAFLSSSRSPFPPSLVSSVNLHRVPSIPLSRSLIKTLNKTGPNTELWGTPLMGAQLDVTPCPSAPWGQPSRQAFTCSGLLMQGMGSQVLQENALRNCAKGFSKVQADNIHSFSLLHCVTLS